ncbi:16S rRNA (cytosine(1402)-N(4))-methyltransferase RsmH [Candidatus Bathyarchaeota archaeon]|nr:MAG: 16S rRNA (cytosine(1402)-N(4))-methyltransferase RsmH [Candidatus Bathyarchaeota archaeon]RJS80650.1 MAG: 16S rRNA (cytosine(1402)-N(4))-methyltransferase RsmH [Candidatus Bathyarchaeota archaeon]
MESVHIPVLQNEVAKFLDPKPNNDYVDCTIGEGGHAQAILEKILPNGKLLGIDLTEELIEALKLKFKDFKQNLVLVCDNFSNLKEIAEKHGFRNVSGVLFDLGLSSWHLEKSGKGFSFMREEPLDMRYEGGVSAEEIVNGCSEEEIARILKEFGEERFARRIAKTIVEKRRVKPIKTTFQLVDVVRSAVPLWYQKRRIHFATKTFQALRIAVNGELENLKETLPQAVDILKTGGKIVVISFHSLEDRIVKNFFRENSKNGKLKILTKKPVVPTIEEVRVNPRARSAKLRVAVKI